MKLLLSASIATLSMLCSQAVADSVSEWKRLTNDANMWSQQKKYDQAIASSAQAFAIADKEFQSTPYRVLTSLFQLGALQQVNGQLSEAEATLSRAFNYQVKLNPNDQRGLVRTLMPLARVFMEKGDTETAITILNNVIQRQENLGGSNSGSLMEPLNELARVYLSSGATKKADDTLSRAMLINKNLGIRIPPEIVGTINELVGKYRSEGQLQEAAALEIKRKEISDDWPSSAWFAKKPEIDFSVCRPKYPTTALKYDLQGLVKTTVEVDIDGTPLAINVVKSSGWQVLDDALTSVIAQCNARPAARDGSPIRDSITIAYQWKIDENYKELMPSFAVEKGSCSPNELFSISADTTLQSTVRIAFKLKGDGSLSSAEIVDGSSTGDQEIDQSALAYLKSCKLVRMNSGNSFGHIRLRWNGKSK